MNAIDMIDLFPQAVTQLLEVIRDYDVPEEERNVERIMIAPDHHTQGHFVCFAITGTKPNGKDRYFPIAIYIDPERYNLEADGF